MTTRRRKRQSWGPGRPVLDRTGDRRTVAALLAERGPLWGDAAAALLGWDLVRWWRAAGDCPAWFDCCVPGVFGWTLTRRGRAEALGGPQT